MRMHGVFAYVVDSTSSPGCNSILSLAKETESPYDKSCRWAEEVGRSSRRCGLKPLRFVVPEGTLFTSA
jgi:hypothetical protein